MGYNTEELSNILIMGVIFICGHIHVDLYIYLLFDCKLIGGGGCDDNKLQLLNVI